MAAQISVLIVEDSAVARELITDALTSDPRLTVVAAVDTAEKALRMIPRLAPDIISMDVRLPGMDGIAATRHIMSVNPTPIVVVAADMSDETVGRSMEALQAGALAVVEKPSIDSTAAYRAMARRLCDQFVNLAGVKVVRQRFGAGPATRRPPTPPVVSIRPRQPGTGISVVGIVASTGGPPAVASILRGLGPEFPAPVLVVQHMGASFLEGYASWLGSVCGMKVTLAREGTEPQAGEVYVGPGRSHLTLRGGQIHLIPDASERGHVPSGDMLLGSLAEDAGARGLGIILTGMGEDGARGLLRMRHAGGHTIGQDRATSAVWGMPAVALAMGAVIDELPLPVIGGYVSRLVCGAKGGSASPKAAAQ